MTTVRSTPSEWGVDRHTWEDDDIDGGEYPAWPSLRDGVCDADDRIGTEGGEPCRGASVVEGAGGASFTVEGAASAAPSDAGEWLVLNADELLDVLEGAGSALAGELVALLNERPPPSSLDAWERAQARVADLVSLNRADLVLLLMGEIEPDWTHCALAERLHELLEAWTDASRAILGGAA